MLLRRCVLEVMLKNSKAVPLHAMEELEGEGEEV
jgi:hypothetical protein